MQSHPPDPPVETSEDLRQGKGEETTMPSDLTNEERQEIQKDVQEAFKDVQEAFKEGKEACKECEEALEEERESATKEAKSQQERNHFFNDLDKKDAETLLTEVSEATKAAQETLQHGQKILSEWAKELKPEEQETLDAQLQEELKKTTKDDRHCDPAKKRTNFGGEEEQNQSTIVCQMSFPWYKARLFFFLFFFLFLLFFFFCLMRLYVHS